MNFMLPLLGARPKGGSVFWFSEILKLFDDNTGRSEAYACDSQGRVVEGTNRFIRNEKIDACAFLPAAFNVTAALAVPHDEVWLMEDTTSLSFFGGALRLSLVSWAKPRTSHVVSGFTIAL